jgi:hypothetical protein
VVVVGAAESLRIEEPFENVTEARELQNFLNLTLLSLILLQQLILHHN